MHTYSIDIYIILSDLIISVVITIILATIKVIAY